MSGDHLDGFDPFVATLQAELRRRQIELAGITGHPPSRRAPLRLRLTSGARTARSTRFSFTSSFEAVLGRGPACLRPTVFVGDPADEVNAWLLSVLRLWGKPLDR